MHPSLTLLLSLTLALSTAYSSTQHRYSLLRNPPKPPREYIEITRPLPFDSLNPSCTLPVLSGSFGNTIGFPPTSVPYSPPINCTWSRAALHISATSNGTQTNRIAAVWIDGVEILRTSTPEPTAEAVFWNIRKDVTIYSSLLRKPNLTLAIMLPNAVNDVFNGVYQLNLTFLFYSNVYTVNAVNMPLPLLPQTHRAAIEKLSFGEIYSLDLNEKPADLIIPVSDIWGGGFWFRIEEGSVVKHKGIRIPLNTYRAVIEVYASFHEEDEFWYSNPPDSYLESNNLTIRRGNGAYREVLVMIDDVVVGSVIPFPVIFARGINPLYWDPIVSIGAFDLPSYNIELTPFLGMVLDGKVHDFGVGVMDALSYWLVDANLHLWLDDNVSKVEAKTVEYRAPSGSIKRKSKFKNFDGKFKIKVKRKSEFSGWINSSFGNLTTYVSQKLKFKNKIKYKDNGTEKQVKQEVNVKTNVEVESSTGTEVASVSVDKKYSLKIDTSVDGSEKGKHAKFSKLENSMEEERSNGSFTSSLFNSQVSNGTMHVQDRVVLSGAASTYQSYAVSDEFGCYTRQASATGGHINNDAANILCASAS